MKSGFTDQSPTYAGVLILASASPRRRELISRLGVPFVIVESGIPEVLPPSAGALEAAQTLALRKARAVATRVRGVVLGADTLIDVNGRILGKPADPVEAKEMLRILRNREHLVITGLALVDGERASELASAVSTRVNMADYPEGLLEEYVESGEPLDKAGGYAIQGKGSLLVDSLSGCYNNVVGLPLCEVAALLGRTSGFRPLDSTPCRDPNGYPCPRSAG